MDCLKKIQILTICVVVFESVTSDRWACDRRHYVEFGQRATISCIFPNDYEGVFWYDSADISANLVIKREKQDNGNFIRAGAGYSNGSYEIEPDGSLVITNVSNVHDRVFFVSLVDDDRTLHNFEVEVVTIYNGGHRHPHLSVCPTSNLCLVSSKQAEELNCSYNDVRPAVMLSWKFSALQDEVDTHTTNRSDGNFTFSSYSSVKFVNGAVKPLVAVTCTASGPALNFQTVESTAVVDITQKSTEEIWEETDIHKVYAEMNTKVEVECAPDEKQANYSLWKLGGINSSQILMFLSDGQMKQAISMNSTIMFSDKGTLTFPNVSIQQEGLYTCVYTDGEEYYSHTFRIIVTVVPSPPAIVAFGCAWNSSECVFLISETISRKVTCMVTGVYPLVDVAVTVANSTGLTIAQQTPNIVKRGEIFDITVKADIHVQHKSQCSMHDVYCFATGPGTTLFHSSRKITLIIDSCNSRVANIIIVALIVGVVCLTVVAALWVRYRKTRHTTYRKNSHMSVLEELVDSLTYWPLSALPSTAFFEEEVLLFLRNVSDEIEKDKKEENERVFNASTDEIVGDSMAAPTLPQRSVPLLNDGAVIRGTGVNINIADSWDKLRKDKQKSILVQKPLNYFFEIQKQLVETTVFLNFAYKAIREVHVHTCFNEIHVEQIANTMTKVKMKQNVNRITLMEQLSYMHSCVLELLTIIKKELSNESSVLVGFSEWENELQKATSLPFDYLPESIKYLVHNEKSNKQVTFLTFVKLFYRPGQGVSHCGNSSGVRFARQDQGNKQAEPVQSAGVLVDVEDDFLVGINNNVYRIARSVSVAGVLLSTLGIMADVAFLGRLISDLEKGGKGRLAGALSEIADMMEKMNLIIKELTYNKQSLVCCCK